MHGDEEHWFRESVIAVAVAEIPDLGTGSLIELGLHHDLLHLLIAERVGVVLVEHLEYLHIVYLVFWF